MGRYIDEILQPGEKVLYSTNAHWIFYLPAFGVWIVVAILLGASVVVPPAAVFCLAPAAVAAIATLYLTVKAWFHRLTTETDVTNMRVVHKTGFIKRRTFEISIDKVASVEVVQSILGRILDYGDVDLTTMGDKIEPIKTIASPLKFRSYITAR